MEAHKKKLVQTISNALCNSNYFYFDDIQKHTTHELFVYEGQKIGSVEFLETLSMSELFHIEAI